MKQCNYVYSRKSEDTFLNDIETTFGKDFVLAYGQWDKTTSKENIRRIINITERQIFKHHNEFMALNNAEQKKLINGMLKSSCFSQLSNMSDSKLYISENK